MRKVLAALALLAPSVVMAQTTIRQEATPVVASGATAGAVVASGGPGTIVGLSAVNGTTAGYAVLYDAPAVPADGALNASLIRWCIPLAASTGIYTPFTSPLQFYYGVTFFVSSTSCTTKAAVTYGYVGVQVRQ